MTTINQDEMMKLAFGLRDRGIGFSVKRFFDGIQIVVGDFDWDAICHSGSYGHENGLIEVMGLPQCEDDVIGYLTAEEILKMVDELIPETIDYDCEPAPTTVKMRMTQKLANDLMDSLAALAIFLLMVVSRYQKKKLSLVKDMQEKLFFVLAKNWRKS